MPLTLPAMNAAIVCNGEELETYDVKQEGTSMLTAFVASEAGKVRTVPSLTTNRHGTNRFAIQQFKITFSNKSSICAASIFLHVDGRQVQAMCLRPGASGEFLGPYNTECSILPLKFQELQLVGTCFFISPSFEHLTLDLCQKTQTWKMPLLLPKWGR
jgi:hypothetical protein